MTKSILDDQRQVVEQLSKLDDKTMHALSRNDLLEFPQDKSRERSKLQSVPASSIKPPHIKATSREYEMLRGEILYRRNSMKADTLSSEALSEEQTNKLVSAVLRDNDHLDQRNEWLEDMIRGYCDELDFGQIREAVSAHREQIKAMVLSSREPSEEQVTEIVATIHHFDGYQHLQSRQLRKEIWDSCHMLQNSMSQQTSTRREQSQEQLLQVDSYLKRVEVLQAQAELTYNAVIPYLTLLIHQEVY